MMRVPSWSGKFHAGVRVEAFAILTSFACALVPSTTIFAQSNALTIRRNLGELVSESQMIVQGWITSVTLEPHPQLKNLMTVVVAVQVEETLKGDSVKTLTFREAVLDRRAQQQKTGFRTGQHVLLLLIAPSQYGLTSPAGMEQGRFRIAPQGDGKLLATNGFGNAGLFRGLETHLRAKGLLVTPAVQEMIAKPGPGPVSLEHLKSLIRTIAAADSTK
jgi:hypothetical protein